MEQAVQAKTRKAIKMDLNIYLQLLSARQAAKERFNVILPPLNIAQNDRFSDSTQCLQELKVVAQRN
jgi:hypothetical protein